MDLGENYENYGFAYLSSVIKLPLHGLKQFISFNGL